MVQYRALVIALILLLSTTVPEVHSKSIFERDRRDWLVIPDAVAAYIYEVVNKVSPRAGQFLVDISQTTVVSGTRYGKSFCASVTIAMGGKGEGGVGERTD
uniref:Apovitellenin-1 n=1 Tax=Pavo cristatus TaxID=9049 RepID=A0A8C9FHJ1_PAVCR